jgi:hypothetical protein
LIRADVANGHIIFSSALPTVAAAYVDADWLGVSLDPVPALNVDAEGRIDWRGDARAQQEGVEADVAAALTLLAVAREAAAAVPGQSPDAVEVIGRGLIAHLVRALIGIAADAVQTRGPDLLAPRAIVDTTGNPSTIINALRRLDDLGTLVVVGESLDSGIALDLYPDLHVRGLTLAGVAPPLSSLDLEAPIADTDPLVELSLERLVRTEGSAESPGDGLWYRVSEP